VIKIKKVQQLHHFCLAAPVCMPGKIYDGVDRFFSMVGNDHDQSIGRKC
jgi:hypothetical protein